VSSAASPSSTVNRGSTRSGGGGKDGEGGGNDCEGEGEGRLAVLGRLGGPDPIEKKKRTHPAMGIARSHFKDGAVWGPAKDDLPELKLCALGPLEASGSAPLKPRSVGAALLTSSSASCSLSERSLSYRLRLFSFERTSYASLISRILVSAIDGSPFQTSG
jgi:hypothetical protein